MARKRKSQPRTEFNPWDELPPELQEMLISILPLAENPTPVGRFPLSPDEREMVQSIPGLLPSLRERLADAKTEFTLGDIVQLMASAVCGLAMLSHELELLKVVADKLSGCLQDNLDLVGDEEDEEEEEEAAEGQDVGQPTPRRGRPTEVYQLKIELLESDPPIWRRIEVGDCTLAELHEHIQTAMGWTNSHLHQFYVGKQIFADPTQQDSDFGSSSGDSTETWLGELIGDRRGKFKFEYEYDFGDSWRHRITVEKKVAADPAAEYPRCLGGERACPPEDCGGVYGYADLLAVLADPSDEEYEDMREWVGDRFDPAAFDAASVSEAMQSGVIDLSDPYE